VERDCDGVTPLQVCISAIVGIMTGSLPGNDLRKKQEVLLSAGSGIVMALQGTTSARSRNSKK
jgi:hypothetical protein